MKSFVKKKSHLFLLRFQFILFLMLNTVYLFSQADSSLTKNSFYLELFGNVGGSFYSVNYEKLISLSTKPLMTKLTFRVGLGHGALSNNGGKSTTYLDLRLPIEMDLLLGQKMHFLEIGAGITTALLVKGQGGGSPGDLTSFYVFRVGYRLMINNFIVMRIAPMLILGQQDFLSSGAKPWINGGLSIGGCF